MRGESRNRLSARKSRTSFSHRKPKELPLNSPLPKACRTVIENLEARQLLSSTTSDGFVVNFYAGTFTSVSQFPATPNYANGDYSTHLDLINDEPLNDGNAQAIAPPNAPSTFTAAQTGGPGDAFSGLFTTTVVVSSTLPGGAPGAYFTFLPTTDDGAEIDVNGNGTVGSGTAVGAQNLNMGRGYTQDTDAVGAEWLAGSTHQVQFYYNNGGGGWGFQLRWAATAASGTGANTSTSLISTSFMTGAGAPGVANLEAPAPTLPPPTPQFASETQNSITLTWPTNQNGSSNPNYGLDASSYIIERSTSATGPFTPVNTGANGQPLPVASADGGTNTYIDTGLQPGTQYYYELVSNSIIGLTNPMGAAGEPTSPANTTTTIAAGGDGALTAPAVGVAPSSGGNVVTFTQVPNATTYDIFKSTTLNGTYAQTGTVPYGTAGQTTLTYTDSGNNADSFYEVEAVDTAVPTTDAGYSATSNPTTLGSGDGFAANYYNYSFNGTPGAGATANGFQSPASTVPANNANETAIPGGSVYVPPTAPTFSTIVPTINTGAGAGAGTRPPVTPTNFNTADTAGQGTDFSIAYEFNVVAPYNEQMTFLPRTDDGAQITVDGVVLGTSGDEAADTLVSPVVDSAGHPVVWQAGTTHSVQFAYFQDGGGWEDDLYWTSPSIAALNNNSFAVPVPQYDAYASGTIPNIPTNATPTVPPPAPPPVQPTLPSAAPAAPTGFTGVENNQSVVLTFNADAAATYNIYQSTTGPITSTTATGVTLIKTITGSPNASPGVATYTYTATGLTNGTTYYFGVTGVDASGEGLPADVTATPEPLAPNAPTGVTAAPYIITPTTTPTPTGTTTTYTPQVKITIPAVSFATGYQIQRAPESSPGSGTPGTFVNVPGTSTTAPFNTPVTGTGPYTYIDTDPTLALGLNYFYQVFATNVTGTSPATTPIEVSYSTGTETHYYNNLYWSATPQNQTGTGLVSPGTGASVGSSNEAAFLPLINAAGADYETGVISTTGATTTALYPDPEGIIGTTGNTGDSFSDVETGKITVPLTGVYSLTANTDDDGFLYVDGTLVSSYPGGHGNVGAYVVTPITLDAGTYDYDFFEANGGGGWAFQMQWNVVGSGSTATLSEANPTATPTPTQATLSIVPSSALSPVSNVPTAASGVTPGTPTINASGNSYSVPVTFTDNATDELQYELQRSTDAAFDGNGQVATVAATGLVDNGQPNSSGATTVPGTGMGTLTDPSAPAGGTFYYRVVALNYDGSTFSTASTAVTTGAAAAQPGVAANWYNNEFWDSTSQLPDSATNTPINLSYGIDSISPTSLVSDESGVLAAINAAGGDGDTGGNISTTNTGAQTNLLYPDPEGIIGSGGAGIANDFSDVFTGQVDITTAGTYTFAANTDDDGFLYVDDQLVSSYPGGHGNAGAETNYPIANLTAGEHNFVFLESNGGGGWAFEMLYNGPDTGSTGLVQVPATLNGNNVLTTGTSPLVAPSGFTVAPVTTNPTQDTLTWNDNNVSAVRYEIQRSTDPTFNTNVTTFDAGLGTVTPGSSTNTITYSDTGLGFNTTYYYRIAAQNYNGSSSFSPSATITTANAFPPVTNVVADQDVNGNIDVSFPAETYAAITGYELLRSTNGGMFTAVTGSPVAQATGAITYTDSAAGLTAGSTYQYEVIVTGATGGPANSQAVTSNPIYYVTHTIVNHSTGFTGEADLTLSGQNGVYTPVVTSNGQLQLTTTVAGESTSAYETTPVAIGSDFSTSFDFQITSPGADGFAFVIQKQGTSTNGGSGGGFGYTGVTPSLAVTFNQYNDVTQTQLGINGALIGNPIDMSGTLGNAFHNVTNNQTDVFQVSLNYQASTQTLFEAVRDTTTGLGYSTSFNLASYGLAAEYLLGPGSDDYIGFTGGTGGVESQQNILDWTVNDPISTVIAAPPPTVAATEDVNDNIQVSFPAAPSNGFTGITYQVLRSVNGSAYAPVGSPIPYSSTATDYTYQDSAAGLVNGNTYQYEAIISGTTPASPATSNSVLYVSTPVVTHTATTNPFVPTVVNGFSNESDLQFNKTPGADGVTVNSTNQLELTDSTANIGNSVFTTSPVQVNNNWQTTFDYQITNPGADGMTFTLQNLGDTALGNGGGSLGYAGGSFTASPTSITSIAFALNMYNTVTQTALGADGALTPFIDMSGSLGNAFHVTPANATTDVFQVSLAYNGTTGDFFQTVRDTGTGLGFSQTITPTTIAGYLSTLSGTTITPAQAQAAVAGLFAAPVYVGFTAGTGGANSTQTINDWTFNAPAVVTASPPTVLSVTPEDNAGNGIAAGSAAKGQRSMETQIAVVFSEPVNLAAGAFNLNLVNNYGSGLNNGAADSAITGVLGTPTNPSGDGVTWIIPILGTGVVSDTTSSLNGTSESYALKGTHGGISGASLNNGVFDLNVTAADVTATNGGPAMTANYTSAAWHRLYGDVDNARRAFNIEYSSFLAAFNSNFVSTGATNYNEDLDFDGDGRVFNSDYSAFLADFGSNRIYTEPQS